MGAHLEGAGCWGLRLSGVGAYLGGRGCWRSRSGVGAHSWRARRLGLRSALWEHTSEGAEAGVEVQCGGDGPSCSLCSRAGGGPLPGPPVAFSLLRAFSCPFFLLKWCC